VKTSFGASDCLLAGWIIGGDRHARHVRSREGECQAGEKGTWNTSFVTGNAIRLIAGAKGVMSCRGSSNKRGFKKGRTSNAQIKTQAGLLEIECTIHHVDVVPRAGGSDRRHAKEEVCVEQ